MVHDTFFLGCDIKTTEIEPPHSQPSNVQPITDHLTTVVQSQCVDPIDTPEQAVVLQKPHEVPTPSQPIERVSANPEDHGKGNELASRLSELVRVLLARDRSLSGILSETASFDQLSSIESLLAKVSSVPAPQTDNDLTENQALPPPLPGILQTLFVVPLSF